MLLSIKVDLILKEQDYKKNILVVCSTSYIKTIFALSAKILVLYIQAFIIEVSVFSLEKGAILT